MIDWVQWPALVLSIAGAWCVGGRAARLRLIGFWLFLVSNLAWASWGYGAAAWAVVFTQLVFTVTSVRGIVASRAADNEQLTLLRPPASRLQQINERRSRINEGLKIGALALVVLQLNGPLFRFEQSDEQANHRGVDLAGSWLGKIHNDLVVKAILPMGASVSNRHVDVPYLGRGGVMNLDQANIIVDTFIRSAQDLQNLAAEEPDPQVKQWLLAEAGRLCQSVSVVPSLPLAEH